MERCFEPVGGCKTIKVNVRIVAATHRDLEEEVQKGNFREDLFYRLSVFPIDVPPLRDRGDDVIQLAQEFLQHRHNRRKAELRCGFHKFQQQWDSLVAIVRVA